MESKKEWKKEATKLYFVDKKNIQDISKEIGVSRKSVSKYLRTNAGYEKEKEKRKLQNKAKRKRYKQEWDKANRADRYSKVTSASMRREHEMAVSILSRDRW